jgi:hypothetical protein
MRTPNTRPSSPASNASTPRHHHNDINFDNLDLSQIHSTLTSPNNSHPSTPNNSRPGTPQPQPLRGGNRKYTNRKGKQIRRHTRRRIHRKVSNRREREHSRLRRRNNLK